MGKQFPPQPWHLEGDMLIAEWTVSSAALPAWSVPTGGQPLRSGQWCRVLTCWVDSRGGRGRARAGVRARLWLGTPTTSTESEGVFVLHRDRLRLPGRCSLRTRLLQQPVEGRTAPKRIPVRLDGQVRLGQARLRSAPDGLLDFLDGRRPLTAFSVSDFRCGIGAPEN
ncbi:hypothetical protein ACWDBD_34895 [Streptomyces sp. NPDC001118]